MKILALSDTHGAHDHIPLPDADVLIHAGDFTGMGREAEVRAFGEWLKKQPHKHKIVIAGNHDITFEWKPEVALEWLGDCIYLNDTGITIDGIKFWGSPHHPFFDDTWAFGKTDEELKEIWAKIPKGTDVLITHGPPKGILDGATHGHFGDSELLKAVGIIKPKIHLFGHIHEHGGKQEKRFDNTLFANVAVLDGNYQLHNGATTFEL